MRARERPSVLEPRRRNGTRHAAAATHVLGAVLALCLLAGRLAPALASCDSRVKVGTHTHSGTGSAPPNLYMYWSCGGSVTTVFPSAQNCMFINDGDSNNFWNAWPYFGQYGNPWANNRLCANFEVGWSFTSVALPTDDPRRATPALFKATKLYELSWPAWNDNFIFVPHNSPVHLAWTQAEPTASQKSEWKTLRFEEDSEIFVDDRQPTVNWNDNHLLIKLDGCDPTSTTAIFGKSMPSECQCRAGFYQDEGPRPPNEHDTPYACKLCAAGKYQDVGPAPDRLGKDPISTCKLCSIGQAKTFVAEQTALELVDDTECFPGLAYCDAQCLGGFHFEGGSESSYGVICVPQYGSMSIAHSCVNINECSASIDNECPASTTCIDESPGYRCVCKSPTCDCYGTVIQEDDVCLPEQCQPSFCSEERSRLKRFHFDVDVEMFFIDIQQNPDFNDEKVAVGQIKIIAHSATSGGQSLPYIMSRKYVFGRKDDGGASLDFRIDADFSSALPDGIPSTDNVEIQLLLSFHSSVSAVSDLVAAKLFLSARDVMNMHPARFVPAKQQLINSETFRLIMTPRGSYNYDGRRQCAGWQCSGEKLDSLESNVFAGQVGWLEFMHSDSSRSAALEQVGFFARSPSGDGPIPVLVALPNLFKKTTTDEGTDLRVPWVILPVGGIDPRAQSNIGCTESTLADPYQKCPSLGVSSNDQRFSIFDFTGSSTERQGIIIARDLEAAGITSDFTVAVAFKASASEDWPKYQSIVHSRAHGEDSATGSVFETSGNAGYDFDLHRRRFVLFATSSGSGDTRNESLTCCLGAQCATIHFGHQAVDCAITGMSDVWLNLGCSYNSSARALVVRASDGDLICSATKLRVERIQFGPNDALVLGWSPRFHIPSETGAVVTRTFTSREDFETWEGARARCKALGVILTTNVTALLAGVSDSGETPPNLWFGLNSLGAIDTWQWIDGRPSSPSSTELSWLNWGEHGNLDFGEANTCGILHAAVPGGLTFRLESCNTSHAFICEVPDADSANLRSFVEFSNGLPWAAAKEACQVIAPGARLAVLSSPQLLEAVRLDIDGLDNNEFWIGFERRSGATGANEYEWLDEQGAMEPHHTEALGHANINLDVEFSRCVSSAYTSNLLCASWWATQTPQTGCWKPDACVTRRGFMCDFPEFDTKGNYASLHGQVSVVAVFRQAVPESQFLTAFRSNIHPLSTEASTWLGVAGTSVKLFNRADLNVNNAPLYCNAFNSSVPLAAWRELQSSPECRPNTNPIQDPDVEDDCWEYHVGWPNNLKPDSFYQLRVSLNVIPPQATSSKTCYRPEDFTAEDLPSNCGSDAWLPFRTTCGCTVDNPTGHPVLFTPFQTTTHIGFKWVDESFCEEGYNFYRGDEAVDVQYTRKGNCFEQHITDNSGDPLANNPLLKVGSQHHYCISAIGAATASAPGSLYASAQVCKDVAVSFVGLLRGQVVSQRSSQGIPHVMVTGLLLGPMEKKDKARAVFNFTESAIASGDRRRKGLVGGTSGSRRRKWLVDSTCPTDPRARDGKGRLVYTPVGSEWQPQAWPEIPAGTATSLTCPYPFRETPSTETHTVARKCGRDGHWEDMQGGQACPDPLDYFTLPRRGNFIINHNDLILRATTLQECAWECVFSANCSAFEFDSSTFSCFHSSVPPSSFEDGNVVESDFAAALEIDLYELQTDLPARKAISTTSPQATPSSPASTVCSMSDDSIFGSLPQTSTGKRFFQSSAHLHIIYTKGCRVVRGDVLIRDCATNVAHLIYLSAVEHITGVLEISNCQRLRFFGGGLARLSSLGSMNDEIAVRITDNPVLEGPGLRTMLATLYDTARATTAVVSRNPRLCPGTVSYDTWPGRWEFEDNAPPALCGCRVPEAQNYNSTAQYHDGTCIYPACVSCMLGTSGNCYVPSGPFAGMCGWTVKAAECAANAICDPCHNVICQDPPSTCHEPDSGVCSAGKCTYTLKSPGAPCDDGLASTGPDTCDTTHLCVGRASCTAPAQIVTQADVDALSGCGTISTDLLVSCADVAGTSSAITSLAPLSSINIVRGGVSFAGCGVEVVGASAPAVLPLLELILGNRDGVALALRNVSWSGAPSVLFPRLERAVGTVHVAHSPTVCINELWHDDYTIVGDVASSSQCGCLDPTALNYDATATVDDGTCMPDLCYNVSCSQTFPCYGNGTCDQLTGECVYPQLEIGSTCDDGLAFTFNDTCDTGAFGDLVCSGLDLCTQTDYCVEYPCQTLVGCHEGRCLFEYAAEGEPCDDGLDYTSFEKCSFPPGSSSSNPANLVCGGEYLFKAEYEAIVTSSPARRRRLAAPNIASKDPCFEKTGPDGHSNVLEIRFGKTCILSTEKDYHADRQATFEVGAIATFDVSKPLNAPDGRFQLKVFEEVTVFPSPNLTPVAQEERLLPPQFDGTETVQSLQGHWTIELEPNLEWLAEHCSKTCLEEAQVVMKRTEGVDIDARPDLAFWFEKCGFPGVCVPDNAKATTCSEDSESHAPLCDRYRHRCLHAQGLPADPYQLVVNFWSHNLLRDHLLDYQAVMDLPKEAVDKFGDSPFNFTGPPELQSDVEFAWYSGNSTPPSNYFCVEFSGRSSFWTDHYLCSNVDVGLEYSSTGRVEGKHNARIEGAGRDCDGDFQETYLAVQEGLSLELRWSSTPDGDNNLRREGFIQSVAIKPIGSKDCTNFLFWKVTSRVDIYNFDIRPFHRVAHGTTVGTGTFDLSFVSPTANDDSDDAATQLAVVYPFAITGGILHNYVAKDAAAGADETHLAAELVETEHLQLTSVPTFADATGYHISGSVVHGDANLLHFVAMELVNPTACPVQGARVCAYLVGRENPIVCNETVVDGTWSLYVVGNREVEIRVEQTGRQFLAVPTDAPDVSLSTEEVDGENRPVMFRLERFENNVDGLVFHDMTVMFVDIGYGGGTCLHGIGDAAFVLEARGSAESDVRPAACQLKETVSFVGAEVADGDKRVLVPAQNYTVIMQADSVTGLAELEGNTVVAYFQAEGDISPPEAQAGLSREVLFSPSDTETGAPNAVVASDGDLTTSAPPSSSVFERRRELVRVVFEYHAVPLLTINIDGTERRDCSDVQEFRERVYVMRTGKTYRATVDVVELYPSADGGDPNECHDIPGSLVVEESVSVQDRISEFVPIEAIYQGGRALAAQIQLDILAGPPNIVAPYTKDVRVTLNGYNPQQAKPWPGTLRGRDYGKTFATVVVEGSEKLSDRLSMGIPEYVPFMILRDPPGGKSSATFSKTHKRSVKLAIKRDDDQHMDFDLEALFPSSSQVDVGTCKGAPTLLVCTPEVKLDSKSGIVFKANLDTMKDSEASVTLEMSTKMDISTADNANLAGPAADIFVNPSLSIIFALHAVISVPDGACSATRTEQDKWYVGEADSFTQSASTRLKELKSKYDENEAEVMKAHDDVEKAHDALQNLQSVLGVDLQVDPAEIKQNAIDAAIATELEHHAYWNSIAIHTRYDIRTVRIPQLQARAGAAAQLIKCKEDYDPSSCPSLKVLQSVDLALEKAKKEFAEEAIKGWLHTLALERELTLPGGKPSEYLKPLVPSALLGNQLRSEQIDALRNKNSPKDLSPDLQNGVIAMTAASIGTALALTAATGYQSSIVAKKSALNSKKLADDLARAGVKSADDVLKETSDIVFALSSSQLKTISKDGAEARKFSDDITKIALEGGDDADGLLQTFAKNTAPKGPSGVVAKHSIVAQDILDTAQVVKKFVSPKLSQLVSVPVSATSALSKSRLAGQGVGSLIGLRVDSDTPGVSSEDLSFLADRGLDLRKPTILDDLLKGFKTTADPNMISFSGGGSTYTFETESSKSSTLDNNVEYSWNFNIGGSTESQFSIKGVDLEGSSSSDGTVANDDATSSDGIEHSASVSSSFTLGDPDLGDQFDVKVWIDPVYQTPVFQTVSGQSMCAHEPGTTARERYDIGINSLTSKNVKFRPTAADNYNKNSDSFELEVFVANLSPTGDERPANLMIDQNSLAYADRETSSKSGMLYFKLDDMPWKSPYQTRDLRIAQDGPLRFIVTVRRPALARNAGVNEFKGIRLLLTSGCEYDLWYGDGLAKPRTGWETAVGVDGKWLEDDIFIQASASFDLIFPDKSEFIDDGGGLRRRRDQSISISAHAEAAREGADGASIVGMSTNDDSVALQKELAEIKDAMRNEHELEHQVLFMLGGLIVVLFLVILAVQMSTNRRNQQRYAWAQQHLLGLHAGHNVEVAPDRYPTRATNTASTMRMLRSSELLSLTKGANKQNKPSAVDAAELQGFIVV